MTDFTFAPAVRENVSLMIGLGGPSGSGKTFSALRIARGLAQGRPIFYIDTEARRALHYADQFDFRHLEFRAPFSPERYEAAIGAAVKAGAGVVIVDSMSHEHEGPGGILEWHETELDRMAGQDWKARERMTFAAWIKPKAAHNRLINYVLQEPIHFVFCFRAKDKMEIKKNERGKNEPVSVGWTPICADRFEFEMTTMLILPPGARGVPDLDARSTKLQEQHRGIIRPGQPLDESVGEQLAAWAKGGKAAPVASGRAEFIIRPAPGKTKRVASAGEWRDEMLRLIERVPADGISQCRDAHAAEIEAYWRDHPEEVETVSAAFARKLAPADDFPGDRPAREVA